MLTLVRPPETLSALETYDAYDARFNFRLFVPLAWPIIEPGRSFVPGWHLDAIADHLTAVSNGQIKRLLVNMPPRHGKSSLISALWSAWLLLNNPAIRLLCASYAMNLATRDNLKTRRVIKSPWFQSRYNQRVRIVRDQDAKIKFETSELGYRMAVSVGSSATGEGGDILILDDPHNIDEKESDAKRLTAIDWFVHTFSTRLNDQQSGAIVVVSHRIHEHDVSGHILETNDGEWVHLNLPAEYEPSTACSTPVVSASDKEYAWKGADPRKEEGELLWQARFPQEVIERAKRRHGPLEYSALYGQRPIPPGGYVFKQEHERLFTIDYQSECYLLHMPDGIRAVPIAQCSLHMTSDVAAKAKEQNDFTVFCVWAVTPRLEVLLLYVFRDHLTIPKQVEEGYKIYLAYVNGRFQAFWFEDVAYQSALGQFLLEKGVPCLEFHPVGDKVLRAGGASIQMRIGNVYFLAHASWLEAWRDEIYKFPKAEHDDQVDNFSQICIVIKQLGRVEAIDESIVSELYAYKG